MNKRGRPTLARNRRKSAIVCVRIDEPTYRQFKRAADRAGMSLTHWVRERLVATAQIESQSVATER